MPRRRSRTGDRVSGDAWPGPGRASIDNAVAGGGDFAGVHRGEPGADTLCGIGSIDDDRIGREADYGKRRDGAVRPCSVVAAAIPYPAAGERSFGLTDVGGNGVWQWSYGSQDIMQREKGDDKSEGSADAEDRTGHQRPPWDRLILPRIYRS